MKQTLFFFIFLFVVSVGAVQPARPATAEDINSAMIRHLNCFPLELVNSASQEISITDEQLCLAAIYIETGLKPLWVSENGPDSNAAIILDFLVRAKDEGLMPDDYNIEEMTPLWQSRDPDQLARLDTLLTLNLIKYAHDVSYGRILPHTTDPQLFAEAGDQHFKPVRIIQQALNAPDLAAYLAGLPPSHEIYRRLRSALKEYRELAGQETWQPVDPGKTLHPGDSDKRIPQVRKRLIQTGHLDQAMAHDLLFDDHLARAVRQFQEQFGLEQDGIIGRKTMAALNTQPESIIRKIVLNMARWRWQEHELGSRYIMVNIANYDLRAVKDNLVQLEMAVIVGKTQHQTPVFSHRIQYIDFNPFWNIPPSIALNEELPELRKDPFYLAKKNVRLFSSWSADAVELDSTRIDWQNVTPREIRSYRLRQDPGPWNALGQVKFVFPNRYDVYLHDTPARELFDHSERTFSHGCIRVSKPAALAGFVLAGEQQEWSMEKIDEIMASGQRKVIALSQPLPVHITYQTVWVDKYGIIHFNNDNYGRDKVLAEILFKPTLIAGGSTK